MIYLELFLTFFMIGAVTFGGGYAMLPMIQEQVSMRWGDIISSESLINFVAVSESTPGPFAVNMATYVGSVVGGHGSSAAASVFGSFCATMGVVLPSFVVILLVARFYQRFQNNRIVKGCMTGLKPAVVGLIANAILSVVMTVFFVGGLSADVLSTTSFYTSVIIFGLMLVMAFKKVHPILIVCVSAVLGIAAGYLGWI